MLASSVPIKLKDDDASSFTTYEAERAFRNSRGDIFACNLSMFCVLLMSHSFVYICFSIDGVDMSVGGYSVLSNEGYTIFSVQAPDDDMYEVTLNARSCTSEVSILFFLQPLHFHTYHEFIYL